MDSLYEQTMPVMEERVATYPIVWMFVNHVLNLTAEDTVGENKYGSIP